MDDEEEKQAEQRAEARALASWIERLHWPQVFLFTTFIASLVGGPIAFLRLVPEHTQDKIFALPWSTIIGVGLPLLGVALHGFLAPFMRPMVAKEEPDSKAPPVHRSLPAAGGDPDRTVRRPLRDSQRPTDPEDPETKP